MMKGSGGFMVEGPGRHWMIYTWEGLPCQSTREFRWRDCNFTTRNTQSLPQAHQHYHHTRIRQFKSAESQDRGRARVNRIVGKSSTFFSFVVSNSEERHAVEKFETEEIGEVLPKCHETANERPTDRPNKHDTQSHPKNYYDR